MVGGGGGKEEGRRGRVRDDFHVRMCTRLEESEKLERLKMRQI